MEEVHAADTELAERVEAKSGGRLTVFHIFSQRVFPVYGASGSICAQYVLYLQSQQEPRRVMAIRLARNLEQAHIEAIAARGIESFNALSHLVDLDGGDLGFEGVDLRTEAL